MQTEDPKRAPSTPPAVDGGPGRTPPAEHPEGPIQLFAPAVSRRTFMAASAVALTALKASPATRARVTREAVEKLVAKTSTQDLYDELVCGLSFKVTKSIDPSEDTDLLTFVAQFYEAQDIGTKGLTITPGPALSAALTGNPRVSDIIPGVDPNETTLAELFARIIAPDIASRVRETIRGDVQEVASRYTLPSLINNILDDGFDLETVLTEDGGVSEDNELLQFFVDPPTYLADQILDATPAGDLELTVSVPEPVGRSETFSLRDTAEQFEDKVLDLIAGGNGLLDTLFDSEEFQAAKNFVLNLGEQGLDQVNSVLDAAGKLVNTPLGNLDIAGTISSNVLEAVQSPSSAAQAVQDQLGNAQDQLDDVLDYIEGLYDRFNVLPDGVVNEVPGLGYIVSEAAGDFASAAQAIVGEINRAEGLAQDLTGEISGLESQLESLVLSAADLPVVRDAIGTVEDTVSDPLGGVVSAVNTFQENVPGLASVTPDELTDALNSAVNDLNSVMDEARDIAGTALGVAAFSALKANAIFMILTREQIKAILEYGLRIVPENLAWLEALKLYGRWTGFTPIDDLSKLSIAQLNSRVNDEIEPVVSVLSDVRDTLADALADPDDDLLDESISKVISHNLFEASPVYQNRLSVYGVTPGARVRELLSRNDFRVILSAPITAPTFTRDASVTVVGVQLAQSLITRAQDETLLQDSIGAAEPFTLATESLHSVICDMTRTAIRQALIDVVTNYFVTLIQNAFTNLTVDLSAYEDIDDDLVEEQEAATLLDRTIVLGARVALDTATLGVADIVGAAVFVIFAEQIRSVVEEQVESLFDIALASKTRVPTS